MADQNFTISSGFYDAVSGDRTYSADDMNKPYKRLISNGVFATPAGEPSTDFQVLASSGMVINVSPGSGLFGNKWVENTAYIAITVPGNSSAYSRMDSVLVQVDLRQSGRVASIVYRTGTAASVPVAPAINETADVYEYRLANIQVPAAASSITQARITDARGTDECPWVTSLIKQVDTSALMLQWQAAYNAYFNESTNAFNAYIAEKQAAFDDFLEGLTEELSVATNVVVLRSEVCLTAESDQVQIGLPSYDPDTDVLDVYINGLYAAPGDKYPLSGDASYITFTAALAAGTFDLYYGEVKLTADWDLSSLLHTAGPLNFGGWSDPMTDQFLANYAAAPDRGLTMKRFCSYFQNQAPILPVCFKSTSVLLQSGVFENLTSTMSEPFYNLTECTIYLENP